MSVTTSGGLSEARLTSPRPVFQMSGWRGKQNLVTFIDVNDVLVRTTLQEPSRVLK